MDEMGGPGPGGGLKDNGRERSDSAGRVTVRDVAQHAGVAVSTTSRVFTGHPDVSESMRDRVMTSARTLGYEPDFIAQSLRTGRTKTLGFLVADLSNPVFADVIRGAGDHARSRGYAVMLTNSEGEAQFDIEHLQVFLRRRVDGIILLTVSSGSDEIDREMINPSVPMVVFDRDVPRGSRVSSVYWDHAAGFRDATASLLGHGHRSIAFIAGPSHLRPIRERLAGFEGAFHEAGMKVDKDLVRFGDMNAAFGRQEAERVLALDPRPTAIIVAANRLLVGVLEALQRSGVDVGRDVAIVSSDDVELTRVYQPPISVVVRDTYRMGEVAAELLLERIDDHDAPIRSVVLPTRFVERQSSATQL